MINLTVPVVVLGVLLVSMVGVARASHFEYVAQDPNKQVPGQPLTENFVFWFWGPHNATLAWWAQSALLTDVTAAKNNWTAAVPQLPWTEVPTEADADVAFKERDCNGLPHLGGCFVRTEYFADAVRNASYWRKGYVAIRIQDPYTWGDGELRRTLAHEIGHVYGLHERYPEGAGQWCSPEYTVMDGLKDPETTNNQLISCDDLQGPATVDDDRVTAYWSQGEMSSFTATANGSVGTYTWHDDAWAEYKHQPKWFYWNGSDWIEYHSDDFYTAKTDVHRLTEDRILDAVVDRTTYGAPAGTHIACGDPWFTKWGAAGTWRCSNMITLQ